MKRAFVTVQFVDLITSEQSYIVCNGPEYRGSININTGTVSSSIALMLDPSSPACTASLITSPISLNVTGQAGDSRSSETGVSTNTFNGETRKQNVQRNTYAQVFNGTVGPVTAQFQGDLHTIRVSERQRTR